MNDDVEKTLNNRAKRYGSFSGCSFVSQQLKNEMKSDINGWARLSEAQREALEMIQSKIARILNGDPNYKDNWHDIAGYAILVERMLEDETT